MPHYERTLQVTAQRGRLIGVFDRESMFLLYPHGDVDVFAPRTDEPIDRIRFWRDGTGQAWAVTSPTTAEGAPFYRVR